MYVGQRKGARSLPLHSRPAMSNITASVTSNHCLHETSKDGEELQDQLVVQLEQQTAVYTLGLCALFLRPKCL